MLFGAVVIVGSIDVVIFTSALSFVMFKFMSGKSLVEKYKFSVWNYRYDYFWVFKKEVESWVNMVGESSLLVNDLLV